MKGFGVQDTHTLPHQLTGMPGGRIVFSQGVLNGGKMVDASGTLFEFNKTLIASIKTDGMNKRIIGAGLNNIWSWAHSRRGRVFIHEANDLGYSIVPLEEDTSYPSFKETRLHPSSPLHPPTAEGLNLGETGFSGVAICDDTGGSYPRPWAGLTFVADPITGRINSVLAVLGDNGVWTFKKQPDLVACSDPMFRPIAITFGPDGCLYITDWYNRIISHNEVARDHPGRDKERGRVWRVRHKTQPPPRPLDMTKVPDNELPRRLAAANTWEMRAAWHQIVSRKATALSPALVSMMGSAETADDARIHALWSLEELGYYDAELWRKLLANPSPDVRREAVRALSTLKVSEDEAFRLFQPLADEESWTVRYEILRFFRRAEGSVNQQHVTWLRRWSESPAPRNNITGWGGQYLALGGSYERAFQDFLLRLAESKTGATLVGESKWNKVIAILPTPTTEETALKARRHAAVKSALPAAKAQEGKAVVQSLCLSCHSIAGKGAGFAPPLDGSESRDLDSMITAIISPNEAVENVFRLYRLEKIDGSVIEGFKRSEDAIDIVIMLLGGVENRIPIGEIKSAGYVQNHSMMPDVTAGMSELQVAAIVAFLRTVK